MTTVSLSRRVGGLVIVVLDKYLAEPAHFLVMMWSVSFVVWRVEWSDVDRGQITNCLSLSVSSVSQPLQQHLSRQSH